ncbi:hypothetical protein C8R44DRAFT_741693 [Mycena epipterygia]|nr:hypothetical protein C8R44DRAFT_741693 [Mycena epipterygia]
MPRAVPGWRAGYFFLLTVIFSYWELPLRLSGEWDRIRFIWVKDAGSSPAEVAGSNQTRVMSPIQSFCLHVLLDNIHRRGPQSFCAYTESELQSISKRLNSFLPFRLNTDSVADGPHLLNCRSFNQPAYFHYVAVAANPPSSGLLCRMKCFERLGGGTSASAADKY